jgi:tetratricopeptide (TPR) repeat protein
MKFASMGLLTLIQRQWKTLMCGTAAAAWLVLFPAFAQAHGELEERIEGVSVELTKDPTRAELWLKRADLRRQHGELAAALSDVDETLRLKPDWPAAELQRARILLDLQKHAQARAAADACLAREPENPDALVIRSRCHTQLGETNAAISDLSVVLTGEHRPQPDLYLERARLQAAQGSWKDAVKGLDEGMARLGETPSLAFPALEYERKAGEFESALARLQKFQRFMPPERVRELEVQLLADIEKSGQSTTVDRRDPSSAP